jgi:hypothetical protein
MINTQPIVMLRRNVALKLKADGRGGAKGGLFYRDKCFIGEASISKIRLLSI